MSRSSLVILIAGTRKVGKTSYVKEEMIIPSLYEKKLIVDTFDSEVWRNMKSHSYPLNANHVIPILEVEDIKRWKNGLYRCFSSDTDLIFSEIEKYLINSLVVFEDATKYFGTKLTRAQKKFVIDSKQKSLELIFVFHSLAAIPSDLIRVADILILFKTKEGVPSKDKYPFPEIPEAMQLIRESKNKHECVVIELN